MARLPAYIGPRGGPGLAKWVRFFVNASACSPDTSKIKVMVSRRTSWLLLIAMIFCTAAFVCAQVIEYEVNGMKYQTLSRQGLTVIVTRMPNHVAGFGLVQVSISNGSDKYWTVDPRVSPMSDLTLRRRDLRRTGGQCFTRQRLSRRCRQAGELVRECALRHSAHADDEWV